VPVKVLFCRYTSATAQYGIEMRGEVFCHNLLPMELVTMNVNKTYSSESAIQSWMGLCLSRHSWKDPKTLKISNTKGNKAKQGLKKTLPCN